MFLSVGIRAGVLLAATTIACPIYADDKSDFDDFEDEYEDLVDEYDDLNDRVTDFLEVSKDLRRQDQEELEKLIQSICGLDIESDGDEATTIANDLIFDAASTVSQFYDRLEDDGDELLDDLEEAMNDQKSLRDQYKDLVNSAEVGDNARSIVSNLDELIHKTTTRYGEISDDYRSLTNIKEGVPKGTNNPTIRAKLEYGKIKHKELQGSCDEWEVDVSGGRADCVRFTKDNCLVVEFKPDTYSRDDAIRQAAGYIVGIQSKYKDDSRAVTNCEKDGDDGPPVFKPEGELYAACRP